MLLGKWFVSCACMVENIKVANFQAAQLLAALAFLRQNELIHADIKPENVLLADEDGSRCKIRLADFGNMLRNTEEDISQYYDSFQLQTLFYRAPEVILGTKFGNNFMFQNFISNLYFYLQAPQ